MTKSTSISMARKFITIVLTLITIVSCVGLNTFAATTVWEPIVKRNLDSNASVSSNVEQYKIKLGWFTTSKKVTLGTSNKYNSTYGASMDDVRNANSMARFDVVVQYNGKNACYIRRYCGLKAGDSFYLTGKKWNENKTYTITVTSYFVGYNSSKFGASFCNYQMKY